MNQAHMNNSTEPKPTGDGDGDRVLIPLTAYLEERSGDGAGITAAFIIGMGIALSRPEYAEGIRSNMPEETRLSEQKYLASLVEKFPFPPEEAT